MKAEGLEKHFGKYDIVYVDPPWPYYGSQTKMGAAGKEYKDGCMTMEEIKEMPVSKLFRDPKKAAVFMWVTCPKQIEAADTGRAWGLHYRGEAFTWIKTRKADGGIISGMGTPATSTKPTTEKVWLWCPNKTGRPFPLLCHNAPQVTLHPRGRHSEKPATFRDQIVALYGDRPRIELFAREKVAGWDAWGNEVPE